jgi:hypothetical protein
VFTCGASSTHRLLRGRSDCLSEERGRASVDGLVARFQQTGGNHQLMTFLACDTPRRLREGAQPRHADGCPTVGALAVATGFQPGERRRDV